MDAAARVAGIADIDDPTADPSKEITRDVELGSYMSRKSENNSRASLPISHRSFSISSKYRPTSTNGHPPAHHSGADLGNKTGEGDLDDERMQLGWDSSHPCWPHLNVHQPLNSPLYNITRIIRIKRDWNVAGDLAPTFSLLYPEIFEPLLSEEQFRELVTHINDELIRIFNPFGIRAWLDAGLGLATGWLWEDLGLTGVKRDLAKLDAWIENWNRIHGRSPEFEVIPLRRTAYLSLDVQTPDPQICPDVDPTEADARSINGSIAAFSRRMLSVRHANGSAASPANGQSQQTLSNTSKPTDDGAYGAYPVVPPIPGKYLEEARDNVSRQDSPRNAGPNSNERVVAAL